MLFTEFEVRVSFTRTWKLPVHDDCNLWPKKVIVDEVTTAVGEDIDSVVRVDQLSDEGSDFVSGLEEGFSTCDADVTGRPLTNALYKFMGGDQFELVSPLVWEDTIRRIARPTRTTIIASSKTNESSRNTNIGPLPLYAIV